MSSISSLLKDEVKALWTEELAAGKIQEGRDPNEVKSCLICCRHKGKDSRGRGMLVSALHSFLCLLWEVLWEQGDLS